MGHSTPEWVFIGVVVAILIWVGAEAWQVEHSIEYAPANAETIRVVGQQWFWSFEHADGTKEINELHVKEGIPYRFEIVSTDVIHSFSIPDFTILMDAVPGRVNIVWNTFDEPGQYLIECREYCGMLHQDMRANLIVEPSTPAEIAASNAAESDPTVSQGSGTATIVAPGGSESGSQGSGTMRVVEPGDLAQDNQSESSETQNATSAGADGEEGNQTSGQTSGVTLSIPIGAATPGNPAYEPASLTVTKGDIITVINDDSAPHTVTSGTGPQDPQSGQSFDTSIIMGGGETAEIDTSTIEAGEYPYYCTVHPFMIGTLTVQ